MSTDNVIVYGNSLDVFCCVQALLSLGIEGEKIILIQPPLEYEVKLRGIHRHASDYSTGYNTHLCKAISTISEL